jgi:hypothetical protein
MKSCLGTFIVVSILTISLVIIRQKAQAQITNSQPGDTAANSGGAKTDNHGSSPNSVTQIPSGYRDWRLISVAREEGNFDDIRAILGNDVAIKAYRQGTLPFPEGAILARIAWSYVPSEENNKVFGRAQSFVAGAPKEGVQFMVKDSRKFASTGGWGFAQFYEGNPVGSTTLQSCFACHQAIKSRDFVFTRYSP